MIDRATGAPEPEASMQLTGIHHLTAISADAHGNLRFYTFNIADSAISLAILLLLLSAFLMTGNDRSPGPEAPDA